MMNVKSTTWVIVFGLALLGGSRIVRGQEIFAYDLAAPAELPVSVSPDHQDPVFGQGAKELSISGNICVWSDSRNVGPEPPGASQLRNWDIFACDITAPGDVPICLSPTAQRNPDISGNIVVWDDYRNGNSDIYGYDLSTSKEFAICTNSGNQYRPRISGNMVVWNEYYNYPNRNDNIYGKNLATGQEFAICTKAANQYWPDVSGNIVVWVENQEGEGSIRTVCGYDLATDTEFEICTNPVAVFEAVVSGNLVAWRDYRNADTTWSDIYGYDLTTGTELEIAVLPGQQSQIAIDGDVVLWIDHGGEMAPLVSNIHGFRFGSGAFLVPAGGHWPLGLSPAISGDTVVFLAYPEPATLTLLALGGLVLLRRLRRDGRY